MASAWRVLEAATGFLGLPPSDSDIERAGVVVVPLPFERTSSFGQGSKDGPARIITASHQVELFDEDRQCEPFRQWGGIATLAPLIPRPQDDGAAVAERLNTVVSALLAAGKRVVTLGGEHSSIVGSVRAHAHHFGPFDLLQFDAHSDLRPQYEGSPWNHACAMARARVHARRLVQVGIRALDPACETERDERVRTFFGRPLRQAIRSPEGQPWWTPILSSLQDPVYVTFDCDVLDPSLMPATGTPEPGGLLYDEVLDLIDALGRQRRVIGFDVSELAPIPGLHHPEFTMARLLYKMMAAFWS